jgi:hypothetical protein
MDDEYLTKCVVDPIGRKFYLYSSEGMKKEVACDTINQFMNVLQVVRKVLDEDTISYKDPL